MPQQAGGLGAATESSASEIPGTEFGENVGEAVWIWRTVMTRLFLGGAQSQGSAGSSSLKQ